MSEEMNKTEKKIIPLQEGLFAQGKDGQYHLLASHCENCKLTFFPKRKYCGKCGSPGVNEIFLSDRGKVYTFSRIDRKSSVSLVEPPYMQAEVEMPEGVHVFTVLDQCDLDKVGFGMDVEVYVDKIKQDNEGNDVLAYKFKPAD